jgi:hypothetical protein
MTKQPVSGELRKQCREYKRPDLSDCNILISMLANQQRLDIESNVMTIDNYSILDLFRRSRPMDRMHDWRLSSLLAMDSG